MGKGGVYSDTSAVFRMQHIPKGVIAPGFGQFNASLLTFFLNGTPFVNVFRKYFLFFFGSEEMLRVGPGLLFQLCLHLLGSRVNFQISLTLSCVRPHTSME